MIRDWVSGKMTMLIKSRLDHDLLLDDTSASIISTSPRKSPSMEPEHEREPGRNLKRNDMEMERRRCSTPEEKANIKNNNRTNRRAMSEVSVSRASEATTSTMLTENEARSLGSKDRSMLTDDQKLQLNIYHYSNTIRTEKIKANIQKNLVRYYFRDHIDDEPDQQNIEPCSMCKIRVAQFGTNPCLHGKFCKYCLYKMISDYPPKVECSICGIEIDEVHVFRRGESGRFDKLEQVISRHDMAWDLMRHQKQSEQHHHSAKVAMINNGYESSRSGSRSGGSF